MSIPTSPLHGQSDSGWQDQRILELIKDNRIWDMGFRLASVPVADITTDGRDEIIDGPLPTPTDDFVKMAGFEFVRRRGHITAEHDAVTVALATLAVRCWPMEELLRIRAEMNNGPAEDNIEPTGNGPIGSGEGMMP